MLENGGRPAEPPLTDVPGTVSTQPVPTASVQATARRPRLGWPAALLAIIVVGAVALVGARLLQTPASSVALAGWAPTDTLLYAEARLDLPGDQGQRLGEFLGRFPGLGGATDVDARLSEALDQLIRSATDGEHDYSTEIKPWFTGVVAVALAGLPSMGSKEGATADARAVLIAGVRDATAASAWVEQMAADVETKFERSTRNGVNVFSADRYSVAVMRDVLLAGTTGEVTAAIDRAGVGGLATVPAFRAALADVPENHLLTSYVDMQRYMDWVLALTSALGGDPPCTAATGALPAWWAGTFAAAERALTVRGVVPHVAVNPVTSNAKSALLAHLPASTLAVFDIHELGKGIRAGIDQLRQCSDEATVSLLAQIDKAVGALGGWEALTGPVGETAFVLGRDDAGPTGGVAFVPSDRASADRLVTQLESLLALAGGQLTVREESYAGHTLKLIAPQERVGSAPSFAWVVTDGYVALGLEAWVKSVIDTTPGASLASDPAFTAALARVDAEHAGLAYVDIAGILEVVEGLADAAGGGSSFAAARPWLAPLDALIFTATVSGELDRFNGALIVK